jgi:cytochrome P450
MTVVASEAEELATRLFRTSEGRTNPYPIYRRLREIAPVYQSETVQSWLLTRYDDCYSILRDPRLGKDYVRRMDLRRPYWREHLSHTRVEKSMLNVDGPYHTRLRRLVSKVFTFRSVEALKPAIERMVDDLIEPLAEAGGGDLIEQLAFPLPVSVIGELLGVPPEDRPQFRDIVRDTTAVFEFSLTPEQLEAADKAALQTDEYFFALIASKRAESGDDLLSRLIARDDGDDALDDEELVTLCGLLFAAGFETTTNLLGNGMVGMLRQPEQMELLRTRPELYENLSDELLRYDGTAQMVQRIALDTFEIDGETIRPGEAVFGLLGAGNHDPARFSDPDRIDVTRTDIRPLSFGGGVHFCLGAALARAEVEIVFRKLLDRFAVIESDGEIPEHRDRLALRGVTSLPLVLKAEGRVPTVSVPAARAAPTAERETPTHAAPRGISARPAGADDHAWRAAYRQRMEQHPSTDESEIVETIALLGRVPLFTGCSPDELQQLARTAYPLSFDPGDVLCTEGEDAPECYVIAAGEATVTIGGRIVAKAVADEVVGEKGPLEDRPRAATVTASTHMITYAISREHLTRLLEESPAAAQAMRDELRRRYGAPVR